MKPFENVPTQSLTFSESSLYHVPLSLSLDIFEDPIMVGTQPETPYNMTDKGIVWPGEKNKYKKSSYNIDQVIPPPLWRNRNASLPYAYPDNYTQATGIYDPSEDEHFMVWMRTAGLPTFRKLYKRQDTNTMPAGRYRMVIHDSEY